jgi:hypothetical protein
MLQSHLDEWMGALKKKLCHTKELVGLQADYAVSRTSWRLDISTSVAYFYPSATSVVWRCPRGGGEQC